MVDTVFTLLSLIIEMPSTPFMTYVAHCYGFYICFTGLQIDINSITVHNKHSKCLVIKHVDSLLEDINGFFAGCSFMG